MLARSAFLFIFIAIFISLPLYGNSNDSIDTYLVKLSGEERLNALNELGYKIAQSQPDRSIELSLLLMNDAVSDKHKGEANYNLGEAYFYKEEYEEALKYYSLSLPLLENANDSSLIASVYSNIGLIYLYKSNYESSLHYYEKSLELEIKRGDKDGIATCYQNIGLIFGGLNKFEVEKSYYDKALEIYEELGDKRSVADISLNFGVSSINKLKYAEGEKYYKKALKKYEELNDTSRIAAVMNNLGCLSLELKNNQNAIEYFYKAKELYEKISEKTGLIYSILGIGDTYAQMGKDSEAIELYQDVEKLNEEVGFVDIKMSIIYGLVESHKKMNNFKAALPLLEEYYALKDSVFYERQNDKILELENKYNFQKKLNQIAELESRNKAYMLIILAFLFLLAIGVGYWFFYLRTKRLQSKQRLLQLEQKVLRTQMNPHFIFNSLSAVQCYVLENRTFDAVDFLADFAGLMRLVLQYSQEEYISLEQEKEILDYYINLQNRRFGDRISYDIIIDEGLDASRVLIPPMLGQPFIENSFEHGDLCKKDNGKITVKFKRVGKKLSYCIEDNGVGINSKKLSDNKFVNSKKHKSLALKITRERLGLMNNGNLKNKVSLMLEDREKYGEDGTRVEFTIPLIMQN